ncbi:MAB_1171c family putative transporter [Nocardia colli]|uniref:MAB_1171c family putative transporter n=1 Tax=Nocardia colli TaxID=2545717 RepID=UPI0035D945B5
MNSAPPLFTGIMLLFVGAVVAGRWWLVNDTLSDHLINRAMTWDISGVVGFGAVTAIGYPDFAHRLFAAMGLLALSNAFGFAVLLGGADPESVRARQRKYDAIAYGCAGFELVLALADGLGLHLHRFLDWQGALWAGTELFLAWVGLTIMRACVRELSTSASTKERTKEHLLYSVLFALGFYVFIAATVSAVRTAGGASPRDPGTVSAVADFLAIGTLAALVSLPLIRALIVRAEWDRTGRQCRRLRPLWRDLTGVVPEVVLLPERTHRRGSDSQLYRMTIEIRDALLHLRRYAPDTATGQVDRAEASLGDYAIRIAHAAQIKAQGGAFAVAPGHEQTGMLPIAFDRTAELRNLLALSREWPKARAAVETPADA